MSQGLEALKLCKTFGGIVVANNINIHLKPGARTALIGPNGAGKTTFSNLITGILEPSSGAIFLDGKDISHLKEEERVKAGIAKTFQITTLFKRMTVRENLRLGILERENKTRQLFHKAHTNSALEAEIEDYLDKFRLSQHADSEVRNLAYGQQRLIEMALTLSLKPRILILDEPAAGVPSSDSHLITDAISSLPEGLAVLIIEHDMDLVFEVASSIIVLVNGEILTQGTPKEIASDKRVRDLYLGGHHD